MNDYWFTRRLNALGNSWKLCKTEDGLFEVEVWFYGDDAPSRCGNSGTVDSAIGKAEALVKKRETGPIKPI